MTPLDEQELDVARALGAGSVPEPRRTDAAFVRAVEEGVEEGIGRRRLGGWAKLTAAALAPAAAAAALVLWPAETPPGSPAADGPATAGELYALSIAALDDEWAEEADLLPSDVDDDDLYELADRFDDSLR